MAVAGIEVTVRALATGGSGIADLPDGRIVFVPRTAPGDRACIDIQKSKSRWAVGSLRHVIEPGPDRRAAPCPLYATCGGCQLQHMPYEAQLAWKGRFVADALTRIGGLGPIEPPRVVPSPRTTGYRNRATFTLRRLRGGRVVAGLHALGRPARVVDVHDECLLPEPRIMRAWKDLRECWGRCAELLPGGGRLRLTLRVVAAGVELVVEGGEKGWDPEDLLERLPELSVVRHRPSGWRSSPNVVHGPPSAGMGTAFVQANPAAARALWAHVLDVAGSGSHAIDAYCGIGELGKALARRGWHVVGIERDETASALATLDAPERFRVVCGRVDEHLARLLPAELVVANPPRTGLDETTVSILASSPCPRLVYVSCDPATLARDVKGLAHVYELDGLRAFDLFPQTAHVETVVSLRARGRST
jgi:23S rRNA (uracil1939-C5)-methyltransferase